MPKVNLTPHVYDDWPKNIKIIRTMRGIKTDAKLAEKIGMTPGAFGYRLRNPRSIDGELIDKLCRVLRVKPAQLLFPVELPGENCQPLEVRA